ncbi:nucleotidyltransferase [Clostridium sp. Cult3]|uniref:nucleotidyltransferase n=1 Tax=Clostridium sp. Cult3 TaxID=2079004 RepID=UPI001F2B1983|nr:nucleotidyltransferase [Clostridium sp. Cult3]
MKVVGFITEYNPFHLGHKHHLEISKNMTKSDYSIAVMSGSFVQRGEPSLIDKWTKAKMAIDNGVDLVLELPFIFSTQSAELFAYGGVTLLDQLNIVDYMTFGSELGEIGPLVEIADVLVTEPPYYRKSLRKYLDMGYSFPQSRSNALEDYFINTNSNIIDSIDIKNTLEMSNNILAIEYLKALKSIKSNIEPVVIKRVGSQYKDPMLDNNISSATAIRNSLLDNPVESIKEYVPYNTYHHLVNYISKYKYFNTLNNYNQIIHYLLKISNGNKLTNIIDVETGLENRILDKSTRYRDMDLLVQSISTKRYTKTRIQRILIHLAIGLTKPVYHELAPYHPAYIRVLGSNEKGFILLKRIKEKSSIPIITKFANYPEYNNPYLNQILYFDKKATDLFFLGLKTSKPFMDMDYYTTPYIMKK